ncbi:hypothetical protein ACKKBG_A23010 [Auxenochlorella protothecoides x Auxenochlorella symbiontica]
MQVAWRHALLLLSLLAVVGMTRGAGPVMYCNYTSPCTPCITRAFPSCKETGFIRESQCILSAKALACDYVSALGSGQTSDEEQTQACTPRLRLSLPAFELCMLAVLGACILFIRARTRI